MTNLFEYAPAPESRSIVDVAPSYGLFVDGEFTDGAGTPFKTVNPATEEVLSEVATASEADVDAAVKAARRAFTRTWGPMRPADRGKYLFRIARLLQESARAVAGTRKSLTLELGGKAANIVFDDAAIDQAVEGIVQGIFFNQGHVCCAGSRLLVQESIHDEVIASLQRRISTLRVGDPLDKNTDIGAINSAEQLAKIRELSDVGEAEGARRWQPACDLPDRGYWFPPTVFTEVSPAHRIARDEIFGPVLSVLTFRTPDEAVAKANNTTYGLSAGIWTEKGSRILAIADRLRAGVVWANTFNKFDPTSPFGGYKQSGYGREGGRHGLAAYLKNAQ